MASFAGGALGSLGSIFNGIFGADASNTATQQYLGELQAASQYLSQQQGTAEGRYSPYLTAGSQATNTLANLLGTPGQGLLTPWTQQFQAPTAAQAAETPGYQFQLQQGLNAAQNSAAGNGSLLTGRTLAGLNNYAQGQASTNYQNTFNNALTGYQSAYQTFLNNQQAQYGMLAGQSGQGLNAVNGANGVLQNLSGDIASLTAQQGAVAAGGTLGAANSIEGILPGIANSMSPMSMGYQAPSGGGGSGGFDI
jgi:hypothetical protein